MGTRAGEEGEGVRREATEPEEASARRALPAVSGKRLLLHQGPWGARERGTEKLRAQRLPG